MRPLLLIAVLALALAACAPAAGSFERTGDTAVITIDATEPLYGATLSVVNATTSDERCNTIGEDIACELGDVLEPTTIQVESSGGMSCVLFAYREPGNLSAYRPYTCRPD